MAFYCDGGTICAGRISTLVLPEGLPGNHAPLDPKETRHGMVEWACRGHIWVRHLLPDLARSSFVWDHGHASFVPARPYLHGAGTRNIQQDPALGALGSYSFAGFAGLLGILLPEIAAGVYYDFVNRAQR